jgi:hypothetical protein
MKLGVLSKFLISNMYGNWSTDVIGYANPVTSFPILIAHQVPPLDPPLQRPKVGLHLLWLVSYILSNYACPIPFPP